MLTEKRGVDWLKVMYANKIEAVLHTISTTKYLGICR